MTREEAIKVLNDYDINFEGHTPEEVAEAHEIAIKAIFRTIPNENEQIIRISKGTLKARTGRYVVYDVEWLKTHFNTTEAKLYGQSKAEGARGDIPLQQSVPKMPQSEKRTEERTETHECDCIRRSDASLTNLEIFMCNGDYKEALKMLLDKIEKAPSVVPQSKEEPQPKTGHWIWCASSHKCSNCGEYVCFSHKKLLKYCPECGAKMQEEKK